MVTKVSVVLVATTTERERDSCVRSVRFEGRAQEKSVEFVLLEYLFGCLRQGSNLVKRQKFRLQGAEFKFKCSRSKINRVLQHTDTHKKIFVEKREGRHKNSLEKYINKHG